jgi:hypothetical protein
VGFKLTHHFVASETILAALSPILDKLVRGDTLTFNLNTVVDPLSVSFSTDGGFQYGVDASKVSVVFQHRMRAKPTSGGLPVMEMLSVPMPFTKLLDQVSDRAVEATTLLPGARDRKILRVGIIATTQVDEEMIPPGIARFLSYIERPWKGAQFFNIQIASTITETEEYSDRCIHNLNKPEEPEQLVTLQFDWQRTFKRGQPIAKEAIETSLREARADALTYFEELAVGNRFDEDISSDTVGS